MPGLSQYSASEILDELQRRIHCRGKKESRTILIGAPGAYTHCPSPRHVAAQQLCTPCTAGMRQ